MKTPAITVRLAVLTALVTPAVSQAQEQDAFGSTQELVRQVGELKQAVREIASVLRELLKRQEVSILMGRIEMQARSLQPVEQEVRRVTAEREGIAEEVRMLEARLESLSSEREGSQRAPGARPDEGMERMRNEIGLQIKLQRERLSSVELKLVELENDLSKRRDEMRAWEELVDKRIDLR